MRPSFTRFVRMAVGESEVGGEWIGEGSMVNVWVASANRDTTRFAEPDRFDIGRFPNKHVGYGQGIHYCLGAALARVESTVSLNLLLDRYAELNIRYDGVSYLDPDIMLGATHLPTGVRPV
jgi:cytochrome P450